MLADSNLGKCWPMAGQVGYLTIALARPVSPTAISLEHIPKALAFHQASTSYANDSIYSVYDLVGCEQCSKRI